MADHLYGETRRERGRRMAANESPPYTDPPPNTMKTFSGTRRPYRYWFDGYVEDVAKSNQQNRLTTHGRFIVVRSQKTRNNEGALYTISFKKTARMDVDNLENMTYRDWKKATCTCQDPEVMCKHKYAAIYRYNPALLSLRLRF